MPPGNKSKTQMPQRFLRPGITTSRCWDACSWQAQSFYIRLITLVDDYGRYDADFALLKSHAFPLREDIRAPQVQKLCEELAANQLADFYKADGKQFVQLKKWQERARSESRFPAFDNTCEQMFADVSKCSPPKPSPSPSPSISSHKPSPAAALPLGLQVDEFVSWWGKWLEHLRAKRKAPSIHTQELQLGRLAEMGLERAIVALRHSMENGWQGIYEPKELNGKHAKPLAEVLPVRSL